MLSKISSIPDTSDIGNARAEGKTEGIAEMIARMWSDGIPEETIERIAGSEYVK